jgi:hypothetical protein
MGGTTDVTGFGARRCPTGCGRVVRIGHLMCGPCWGQVPYALKREVWRTWGDLGQGADGAIEAYREARDAAIGAVA